MDCYILSHNGLGDNILMNGALNYFSKYYNNVFFLCKDTNIHHIKYLYENTNIIPISFDSKNEYNECNKILKAKYKNCDVFISGCHKSYLKTQKTISQIENDQRTIFIPSHFHFGSNFYKDIGLNPSIMISHFNLNISTEIANMYNDISKYKLIFLHTESSQSTINLSDIVTSFILKNEYLLICADKNFYEVNDTKFKLANKYVKLPTIIHYAEIIKNAEELHMVDSSISCLSLCLKLSGKTICEKIKIYNRFTSQPIDLSV